MTKEEKQLLLKDLCARLPYRVMIKSVGENKIIGLWDLKDVDNLPLPYLRPMSIMTKEDKEKLKQEHLKDERLFAECLTKAANGDDSMRGKVIPHFAADWCNKNHFDFRGLIPMGLALEALDDMYKQ